MKKLSILAGRELGNEKGELAELAVMNTVPVYDSAKTLLETMKGSTFSGKKISGENRLKRFAMGAAGLILDVTQVGAAAKLLGKLGTLITAMDRIERATYNWTDLLQMIEQNPEDPELYTKITTVLEKKTIVEKAKGAVGDAVMSAVTDGASQ